MTSPRRNNGNGTPLASHDAMEQTATVYVVDDDPSMREKVRGLARLMRLGFREYTSGEAFLKAFEPNGPGCVLLSLEVPEGGGLRVHQSLQERSVFLPTVFLARKVPVSLAVHAMRAGAIHFLEKPCNDDQLWEVIQEGIALADQRHRERLARSAIRQRIAELTPKQRQMLDMIVDGKPNKAIAVKLRVCTRTVELWRAKLMKQLGVKSLTDLLRVGLCVRMEDGSGDHDGCPSCSCRLGILPLSESSAAP